MSIYMHAVDTVHVQGYEYMENESPGLCYAHAQYGISFIVTLHRVQFCSCISVFFESLLKVSIATTS